jgi:sortase (surface protein transpeptidase)
VAAGAPPAPLVVATAPSGAAPARVVAPSSLTLPAIGVRTTLATLGVDATGALVPPSDFARAGWFAQGPAPGAIGPAVLAGHVDSTAGPAVFFRLEELTAGDEVLVGRSDGTTLRFRVTRVARYPKTAFRTAEVYGPTPDAELRLITCGGDFDRSRRSYTDNIVVFARLTGANTA